MDIVLWVLPAFEDWTVTVMVEVVGLENETVQVVPVLPPPGISPRFLLVLSPVDTPEGKDIEA